MSAAASASSRARASARATAASRASPRAAEFRAQLLGGALALLALAGFGAFLGDDDLFAGALELGRELGTQFVQSGVPLISGNLPG